MRCSGDGERDVRGGLCCAAGVAVAGGARKWGLVVVGTKRGREDATRGGGKIDPFYARTAPPRDSARVFGHDRGGLFVAGEAGGHGGIVVGQGLWMRDQRTRAPVRSTSCIKKDSMLRFLCVFLLAGSIEGWAQDEKSAGAGIYGRQCASCHDSGVTRMPPRVAIAGADEHRDSADSNQRSDERVGCGNDAGRPDCDTGHEYATVNGVAGHGGSMSVAGPVIARRMVFAISGYDQAGAAAGNVLLAFSAVN